MIRNFKLRDFTVHNLSRFASTRGLRENLTFKIAYDTSVDVVENIFSTIHKAVKIGKNILFKIICT